MVDNSVSGTVKGAVVQAGTIDGGVHVHLAEHANAKPRQLPAMSRGFTGRDQLMRALDDAVTDSRAADPDVAPIVVLTGMGGVGKTALSIRWAHRWADRFPDGQLYVDLGGYGPGEPVKAAEALAGFLRALGTPPELLPAQESDRAAQLRSLLSDQQVLMVLDNARSEEQVRPLLPGTGACAALVTSRQDLTGLVVEHGAEVLHVDVLPTDEAMALLRSLIGRRADDEPDALAVLVDGCARLPLALRIVAGHALSRPSVSLADLSASLVDLHARLDTLATGDDPRTAVRTVFSWSYSQLRPDVAQLFRLFGVLPGNDVGEYAVAALADLPLSRARGLLAALTRAQMLVEPTAGRFGMHDLLRMYAAELAEQHDPPAERGRAIARLYDYYLHGADKADRILTPNRFRMPLDGESRPTPAINDHQQALDWTATERAMIVALFDVDDPALDARRWQLAYTMRGFFFLTKDWDAWVHTHERALAAAQRLHDITAEAATHNNLGLALLERGDSDAAEPHYLAAQTLFERVGDLRGTGNALGNHAWILHNRGDHGAALNAAHRALTNYRQCGARTNEGITLRGIAVFEFALGRFDDAKAHLAEAMDIFTATRSTLDMAMALNCLGEIECAAGDSAAGQDAHQRALGLSQQQGSEFEEARAQDGLGRAAAIAGDRARAEQAWHAALDSYTRIRATVQADDVRRRLRTLAG